MTEIERVLFVDPGPESSSWALWFPKYGPDGLISIGTDRSGTLADAIEVGSFELDRLVIERVVSYGRVVGRDVFDTCVTIGRLWQAALPRIEPELLDRVTIKMALCGQVTAKDAHLRQAVIDRLGPKPTKKIEELSRRWKGYKAKNDEWQAVALALAWMTLQEGGVT